MKRQAFALMLLVPLAACKPESWEGYVYRDRADLGKHVYIGLFDTLESCRTAARSRLNEMNSSVDKGDYECALNCAPNVFPRTCEKVEH